MLLQDLTVAFCINAATKEVPMTLPKDNDIDTNFD